MKLSYLGQTDPVMTGAILDATLPATNLSKNTITVGHEGPSVSALLVVAGLAFVAFFFTSSTPPPRGSTFRGY